MPRFVARLGLDPELVTKYPDYMTALAKSNEIIPMLDELFATKTVQEWSDILTEEDIPNDICLKFSEVADDPAVLTGNLMKEVEMPSGEVIKMPRTPVYFREAGAPDPVVAPTVGADTEVVLKECGYTDEEIKLLIDESTESGLIDPEQNEYVDNIFDLGDKDAEAIMTPRTDVVCIDLDDPLEESLQTVLQYKYTRYPVCRGSKDRIVGFVHVKDLYTMPKDATVDDLRVRMIQAVPEGVPIAKLLQTLQEKRTKIAVVIDEHGGTAGIVTMSDIMEQIVGRIDDEYAHGGSDEIVQLDDGSYLIDGSLPIDEVGELIGFEPLESEECETAGGLLLTVFDRIPDEGDSVTIEDGDDRATFTVVDMDRHRIDKIRVVLEHAPESDES